MAVPGQLQKDAVPIDLKKGFPVKLGGKVKSLIEPDRDVHTRKELFLNLLLHGEHVLLQNQTAALQIHAHEILRTRRGHPLHLRLCKQILSFSFQLQTRKHLKKSLRHFLFLPV